MTSRALVLSLSLAALGASVLGQSLPARAAGAPASIAIIPNVGQFHERARFVASAPGGTLLGEDGGLAWCGKDRDGVLSSCLRLRFDARVRPVIPVSLGDTGTRFHFLVGSDPSRHRTGVPAAEAMLYRDVADGIDLVVHARRGVLEYDVVLRPGRTASALGITIEGAESLRVADDGALVALAPGGTLRQSAPIALRRGPGGQEEAVPARFRLAGARRFEIVVDAVSPDDAVCVDPRLEWATYVGGAATFDEGQALATLPSGDLVVAGKSAALSGFFAGSNDYPLTAGAFSTTAQGTEAVLTGIRADGTGPALFSTFLGGLGTDEALAVAIGPGGTIVAGGVTSSGDFPTTPFALARTARGGKDGFVAVLSPDGTTLLYGSYVGGGAPASSLPADDRVGAVVATPSGTLIAAGTTASADFPVPLAAFAPTQAGNEDAFVVVLDPSLSGGAQLVGGSFLGSDGLDRAVSVAILPGGAMAVAGSTEPVAPCIPAPLGPICPLPSAFPTTPGVLMTSPAGGSDGFVAVFDSSASTLLAATRFGGTSYDRIDGMAVTPSGDLVVAGVTTSGASFPVTPGAPEPVPSGALDAFVARVSPSLSTLLWSTFAGGAGDEVSARVAALGDGRIAAGATSRSPSLATTDRGFCTALRGSDDAYLVVYEADGSARGYATYFGGRAIDTLAAIAAAGPRSVAALVTTASDDCATTPGAVDESFNGWKDLLVARFDPGCPDCAQIEFAGRGHPGYELRFDGGLPLLGNAAFTIAADAGPAGAFTLCALAIQDGAGNSYGPLAGLFSAAPTVSVVVDASVAVDVVPCFADFSGIALFPMPIPAEPALVGLRFAVQGVVYGSFGDLRVTRGARLTLGSVAP